jgi:hypothetical protein
METKRQKAVNHYNKGEFKKAFGIFSKFRIQVDKQQQRVLQIAYESLTGKASFYQSLGKDTEGIKEQAYQIIRTVFL